MVSNERLKELVSKQPVAVAMYVSGMLASYHKGILTEDYLKCSDATNSVTHGVVLVGYGEVSASDNARAWCSEYWVLKNSWGQQWGENGFFRVCMDVLGQKQTPYGTCLINKFALYPTVDPIQSSTGK